MSQSDLQNAFMECFKKNLKLISQEPEGDGLNRFFDNSQGFPVFQAGKVHVTTGTIEVGDPICYMNTEYSLTLNKKIPKGQYPVFISVEPSAVFGTRFMAAKLDITGKSPVRYELAMPEGYGIEDKGRPGVLAMYGVDAGLACFCDKAASVAYSEFMAQWKKEHPEGNFYNDFLEQHFKEYAEKFPRYESWDGDYMDWYLPGTGHNLVMFASGFGDGAYCGYWGYDEAGEIACLVLRFIEPEAYDVPMPELPEKKAFLKSAQEIRPLIDSQEYCIATDRIVVDGCKVGYMLHSQQAEGHPEDSGWVFYGGDEDDAYLADSDHMGIYLLNTLANYDPEIIPLLDAPVGMAFFRGEDGTFYVDSSEDIEENK